MEDGLARERRFDEAVVLGLYRPFWINRLETDSEITMYNTCTGRPKNFETSTIILQHGEKCGFQ